MSEPRHARNMICSDRFILETSLDYAAQDMNVTIATIIPKPGFPFSKSATKNAEPDRLLPGQLVMAAGATPNGQHLNADQFAAADGQDRRPSD